MIMCASLDLNEAINLDNSHKTLWCLVCTACMGKNRAEIVMLFSSKDSTMSPTTVLHSICFCHQ